jgi:hypothetical protein
MFGSLGILSVDFQKTVDICPESLSIKGRFIPPVKGPRKRVLAMMF